MSHHGSLFVMRPFSPIGVNQNRHISPAYRSTDRNEIGFPNSRQTLQLKGFGLFRNQFQQVVILDRFTLVKNVTHGKPTGTPHQRHQTQSEKNQKRQADISSLLNRLLPSVRITYSAIHSVKARRDQVTQQFETARLTHTIATASNRFVHRLQVMRRNVDGI